MAVYLDFFVQVFVHALAWCMALVSSVLIGISVLLGLGWVRVRLLNPVRRVKP